MMPAIPNPEQDASTLLNDPMTSPEIWFATATRYPIAARNSEFFGLHLLESPERWIELVWGHHRAWLTTHLYRLPETQQRLFTIDCIEHCVATTTSGANDCEVGLSLVRIAVHEARFQTLYPGNVSPFSLERMQTLDAIDPQFKHSEPYGNLLALAVFILAKIPDANRELCQNARLRVMSPLESAQSDESVMQERIWQWERLCFYFRKPQEQP